MVLVWVGDNHQIANIDGVGDVIGGCCWQKVKCVKYAVGNNVV